MASRAPAAINRIGAHSQRVVQKAPKGHRVVRSAGSVGKDVRRGNVVAYVRGKKQRRLKQESKRQLPRYDVTYEDGSGLGSSHFPFASASTVANAKYSAYAQRLWPKVRRHYGLPPGTPMPKLVVVPGTDKQRSALTPWDQKSVKVSSGTALANSRKTNYGDKKGRNYARSVLIHEWAHTRQKGLDPKKYTPHRRVLAEGGAEAFERLIDKKLGLNRSTSDEYREFVKYVNSKKGRRYVLKDQFKGDR